MDPVQTQITAVAVYPDRARITRVGQASGASLPVGLQKVEIPGLPLSMLVDSVRVAARGTAQARLMGIQVQPTYFAETPAEQVRQLEEKIEAGEDELHALEAKAALAAQSKQALNAVLLQAQTYAIALAAGEMDVEAQAGMFTALEAQIEKKDLEIQEIARAKRTLEREIAKLKNDLNQQRSARPPKRFSAFVELEVLEPGDLTLELTYMVRSASWRPLYDARLLESEAQPVLEIGYLAEVQQQTGESWDDVALTLSTARPALAGQIPELDPWYIQPQPPPRPMLSPSPAMMTTQGAVPAPLAERAAPPTRKARAEVDEVQDIQAVTAQVDQSGAAVTYRIVNRAGIPSDGSPHKVTVARFPLTPKLDYVSAPKLSEVAHRRAKLTNDSPYLILPGPANLFAGDEFLGTTNLELVAPQGEFEFYLGVDDRLKVERELKRRDVDKSLIGGKRRTHFAYEITLENLLPAAAKLTLYDHIPVGRHEEIKVKTEAIEPRPAEQSDLNILKWELELAPKEKRVIRYAFTVEFPQNLPVVGLP